MSNKYLLTKGLDKEGVALAELLKKRTVLVNFRNPTIEIDEEITAKFDKLIIDPKKELLFNFLNTTTNRTQEQEATLDGIKSLRESFSKDCVYSSLSKELKESVGDYDYKIAKILKKNADGTIREFNFLPGSLRAFYNPAKIEEKNMPTSLLRLAVSKEVAEETKRELVTFNLVSIVYDEFTKQYIEHKWVVSYTVSPRQEIVQGEITDIDDML